MATAHLLFGFLGAGKTTLAKRLEQRYDAVRFTPDVWMARLFGENPPAGTFHEKSIVVASLLQPLWLRCLGLGVDVVLDYGFWRRDERDRVRNLVRDCGAQHVLYAVHCSEAEARRRVMRRNREPDRDLMISSEAFDLLKARFEPLQPDERFRAD